MVKLEVSAYIVKTMQMFTAKPRLQCFLCIPFICPEANNCPVFNWSGSFCICAFIFIFLYLPFLKNTLLWENLNITENVWNRILNPHHPTSSSHGQCNPFIHHLIASHSFVFSSRNITDFVFKIWIQQTRKPRSSF